MQSPYIVRKKKRTSSLSRSICQAGTRCIGNLAWTIRRRLEFGQNSDSDALQEIINKLSDFRNLNDLKHYHTSSAQFKERTTHLDIPGKVYDLHQHVVKTCNLTNPRPDRSRVSGLRAEEFGDLIFLDRGSTKIGDKTFGFLIVLDGATSLLTAYLCNSTSPSGVISKLHEWMDTFQMNPKAICVDMVFHHPHDMKAFYRMNNVRRFPAGPHTLWPNRAEMGVRLLVRWHPEYTYTRNDVG